MVVAVGGLAVFAAGCSSGDADTPAPPGATASSPSADPIPAVENPRDLSGIPPCELITPEQLASVGIDQAGEPRAPGVLTGIPSCAWQDAERTREVSVSSITGVDGLSNLHAKRDTFAVFEIKKIAGHPAVVTQNIIGGTSCDVTLGAAEEQTFNVRFTSLGYGETPPCPEAERIAGIVVGNLPPLR